MNMDMVFVKDLTTFDEGKRTLIEDTLLLVQKEVDRLDEQGYRQLATGADSILFEKDGIVIKVGIDMEAYRKQGFQGRVMRPFVKAIPDGAFMAKYESKMSMPYVYAYGETWVIMSLIDGRPLSEFQGEEYNTHFEKAAEDYAAIFEYQGILLTDLHDDNIFVDKDGMVNFIDFGHASHFEGDAWQEKFDELEELGEEGFFDTYRASVSFN